MNEAQKKHWEWTKRECRQGDPQERLFIAGERWNLAFARDEIGSVVKLWRVGVSVPEIADRLNLRQEELIVLLMDLADRRKVEARPGGIFGKEW